MGKKKNKVPRISEEEYYAYLAGLKNGDAARVNGRKASEPAPFSADGGKREKNNS